MVKNFIWVGKTYGENIGYDNAKASCEQECTNLKDGGYNSNPPPCKYYNVAKGNIIPPPNPEEACTRDSNWNFDLGCLKRTSDNPGHIEDINKNYYKCFMTDNKNTMCGAETEDYIKLCDSIFDNSPSGTECWKDMYGNCVKLTKYNSNLNNPTTDPFNQATIVPRNTLISNSYDSRENIHRHTNKNNRRDSRENIRRHTNKNNRRDSRENIRRLTNKNNRRDSRENIRRLGKGSRQGIGRGKGSRQGIGRGKGSRQGIGRGKGIRQRRKESFIGFNIDDSVDNSGFAQF